MKQIASFKILQLDVLKRICSRKLLVKLPSRVVLNWFLVCLRNEDALAVHLEGPVLLDPQERGHEETSPKKSSSFEKFTCTTKGGGGHF